MATHSVNRSKHATLVGSTVDTVNFAFTGSTLRVRNRDATSFIYFTTEGTTPTVEGDNTRVIGPYENVVIEQTVVAQVKLISAGTPAYSVELY